MSTFTDGDPPAVAPEPDDRPASPSGTEGNGSDWLQDEIARRMVARRAGSAGRHARRDSRAEPTDGSGYLPRHSVASPPAASPPAASPPAASPPAPQAVSPVGSEQQRGWSGPEPRSAAGSVNGGSVNGGSVNDGPIDDGLIDRGGGSERDAAQPDPPPGGAGPASAGLEVFGGPSLSRPFPKAFRRGPRGDPITGPAEFGGPGFAVPAIRSPVDRPSVDRPPGHERSGRERSEPAAEFGGPGFGASIARTDLDTRAPAVLDDKPDPSWQRVASAEVLPPRVPARLLAPPGHVVEALGRRAEPSVEFPEAAEVPDATDELPVQPADTRTATRPGDEGESDDGESTVLWSADAPPTDLPDQRRADQNPDTADPEIGPLSSRVKVVFSERRSGASAVRTVVDVQEGGAVGELLRSNLIGSQLAVAVRFTIGVVLTLGLLPVLFALFPEIGRVEVWGLRLPWLLLGVLVYPFLLGLGWWHTLTAERVEQNFADHVQD